MSFFDFLTSRRPACRLLTANAGEAAHKYQTFKELLRHNHAALSAIADLEGLYHQGAFSMFEARRNYTALSEATHQLTTALNTLTKERYTDIGPVVNRLDEEIGLTLLATAPAPIVPSVLPLAAVTPDMARAAGSKATNLAIIANELGIPTPPGFVVTARGFERFIEENDLADRIAAALAECSMNTCDLERDIARLEDISSRIRDMIMAAPVPPVLATRITDAYAALEEATRPGVRIAMRSSAVGEDTEASFAGQYVTVLNVTKNGLLDAYREVLASKYTPRSIVYRLSHGYEDRDTPMCVAGIVMVESRASGVVYTLDPSEPDSGTMKIAALLGLGELLAAGEETTDVFLLRRKDGSVLASELAEKTQRLICLPGGGTAIVQAKGDERTLPAVDDATLQRLYSYGVRLEEYFETPQDIEWAIDDAGRLAILQSRPLGLVRSKNPVAANDYPDHPKRITTGRIAAPGVAIGPVYNAVGRNPSHIPDGAILVARTASPDFAGLVGKIRGIITDVGSAASHLASVAREFGIPALFDTRDATQRLAHGQTVTLVADAATVYQGAVPSLERIARQGRKPFFDSPAHKKLRRVLDLVSPLHLTDPKADSFTPAHCQTVHDVIRFSHEIAMRAMFGMCQRTPEDAHAVRLHAGVPIMLYCIDLGDGLQQGLTTCDTVLPEHVTSVPMRALMDGLTHPGISWQGGIGVNVHNFASLMASSVTAETEDLGGDSFAIISRDYLNLSAKFGYHYANIDALCGDVPSQNYVILKFSGGAGSFFGRSLRVAFVAAVLQRLGYSIDIRGDLLEASLSALDNENMADLLDQTGRLLAASRLLDVAINSPADVERLVSMFFDEDYDFLGNNTASSVEGFYAETGNWSFVEDDGERCLKQDGHEWGENVDRGSAVFARMFGPRYQQALDTMESHFYYPMALCKDGRMADGTYSLRIKPVAGELDRAGGIAFGVRNAGNYYVLRLNAIENNIILFRFINNRRHQLGRVERRIRSGHWYTLTVEVLATSIRCFLNGECIMELHTDTPVSGFSGMWTKADSVTLFKELTTTPRTLVEPAIP